jgi:serine/threonine protein kinase
MISRTVSHYNILDELGRGGMGIVYKAEDTKLKRKVALKFLPRHISSHEEDSVRFKIEAQAAAALNHPNIATIYDIEEVEDHRGDKDIFIAMEYIEGRELRDIISSPLNLRPQADPLTPKD